MSLKIGIYTKACLTGGSETRATELCNSIRRYTPHESFLLVRGNKIPQQLKDYLRKDVPVYLNMLKSYDNGDGSNVDKFYEMDIILFINSDNYSWSKKELWSTTLLDKKTGQLKNYTKVDLSKIPQLIFLYNFVLSPSQHLSSLSTVNSNIKIITTNKRFYDEIDEKDKYSQIRHLPRMILTSPIDPDTISQDKNSCNKIRIGQHSKGFTDKWNDDYPELIRRINDKYKGQVIWDFMGMCGHISKQIEKFDNVIIRREFSKSVKDYLKEIDCFLAMFKYSRNEPWCRVIAESMMSGCPIIATNKGGNQEQLTHNVNGFLCDTLDDFERSIEHLINNREQIRIMGQKSIELSKEFSSEFVIKKLMDFISV